MSLLSASNDYFKGFWLFALISEIKGYFTKKLYSDFSYTLAFLTLNNKRNRFFYSCREILNLSDFYRQALLTITAPKFS